MKILVDTTTYRVTFRHDSAAKSTECLIWHGTEGTDLYAVAFAFCHPKDNFARATGRKVAFAKALAMAEVPREQRRQFWQGYWQALEASRTTAAPETPKGTSTLA